VSLPLPTGPEATRAPGLYIHVPFCTAVCPYCDFAVQTASAARRQRYLTLLEREVELWSGCGWRFDTLYFGGGTPSILDPTQLAHILECLRHHLALEPHTRILLEANPEHVHAEGLAALRALGVHTLSLGVQSFFANPLRYLGRRHTPEQSCRAVWLALETGFDSVSLDLIHGLPDDRLERWRAELDQAITLAIPHLSCYQLTVWEGTRFGRLRAAGEITELEPDRQADLLLFTHDYLARAGYEGYEVSSFARSAAHRSPHNRKYWDHTPYLGLGPSAHSFDGSRRWWNERRLADWERRLEAGQRPIAGEERLGSGELALEAVMLGLRTAQGIDLERFRHRFGIDLVAHNRSMVNQLRGDGVLVLEAGWLRPTVTGMAIADALAASLSVTAGPTS